MGKVPRGGKKREDHEGRSRETGIMLLLQKRRQPPQEEDLATVSISLVTDVTYISSLVRMHSLKIPPCHYGPNYHSAVYTSPRQMAKR